MDSTLACYYRSPSFGRNRRRIFLGLSFGLAGLFLNETQASAAPFSSRSLRMSQGASIRAELLPEPHNVSREKKTAPRPTSIPTRRKRDGTSLSSATPVPYVSANPVPYEGLVSLSDLSRKQKTQKRPKQSPKILNTPLRPSQHTGIDCATCTRQCAPPPPKSLTLTNLQIIQCIEAASNPAIRRSLLLALRNKDMVLFSSLVTQYDLLNSAQ